MALSTVISEVDDTISFEYNVNPPRRGAFEITLNNNGKSKYRWKMLSDLKIQSLVFHTVYIKMLEQLTVFSFGAYFRQLSKINQKLLSCSLLKIFIL